MTDQTKSLRRSKTKTNAVIDELSNGQTVFVCADGSKYIGEWKDQRFHGKGELISADQKTHYKGLYENGVMHGEGMLKTPAGTFKGTFINNKMSGNGSFDYTDGSKYIGSFENGERSGKGELTYANKDKYTGEFKSNLPHGEGTFEGNDGTRYKGEWRSGKKHGSGSLQFSSGNKFEGIFEDDVMNGHGEFHGADGKHYVGGFKSGALHGFGKLKQKDGRFYDGEFENNKRSGKGKMTYADGAEYEGEWLNDERHGQGKFKSNAVGGFQFEYNGQWKDGLRDGEGVLTYQGGLEFRGSFAQGRPLPGGTFQWPDGLSTKFVLEDRFKKFLGPGSNPAAWETALLKIMDHWHLEQEKEKKGGAPSSAKKPDTKATPKLAQADADDDEDDKEGDAPDGEWEEVELDANGIPIESTARPVKS